MSERAGKDLLLKLGATKSISTTSGSSAIACSSHALGVGDILIFPGAVGANTTLVAGTPYYVKTVTDANTVVLAASPGGAAILADDTEVGVSAVGYSTIGGLRSHSMSFGAEAIDGTNYGSDQWKSIIDGAGVRSMSVSGDGVFNNADNFESLQDSALANTNVKLALVDIIAGIVFSGAFKVTSMEMGASHDAEGTFSMSAESSGAVTVTRVA